MYKGIGGLYLWYVYTHTEVCPWGCDTIGAVHSLSHSSSAFRNLALTLTGVASTCALSLLIFEAIAMCIQFYFSFQ